MKKKFSNTECVLDAYDDVFITFEEIELLRGMKHDILTNRNEVIKDFDALIAKLEERLIDRDICPLCGDTLIFEHDSSRDTYVPFGYYSVIESKGGDMVCTSCGFRRETRQ